MVRPILNYSLFGIFTISHKSKSEDRKISEAIFVFLVSWNHPDSISVHLALLFSFSQSNSSPSLVSVSLPQLEHQHTTPSARIEPQYGRCKITRPDNKPRHSGALGLMIWDDGCKVLFAEPWSDFQVMFKICHLLKC